MTNAPLFLFSAIFEYGFTVVRGRIFGISEIIRYLRNPNPKVAVRILRAFAASIGEKTTIKRGLLFDNVYEDEHSAGDFRFLTIGMNCYIGDDVFFDLADSINIGNDVVISGRVSILTHADCNRSKYLADKYPRVCLPVVIGDGAWIGFGTTILAGVTIGERAVVAANSLVRENVDPFSLFGGIPAIKILNLEA